MRPLDEQQFPAVVRLNRDGRAERVLAVVHPTAGRAGRPLAPAAAAQLGRMPAPGAEARLAGVNVVGAIAHGTSIERYAAPTAAILAAHGRPDLGSAAR